MAAVIDDVVVAGEHSVGEPVLAQELPDILLRVQFRTLGGQRNDGDVARHVEPCREVPSGLIHHQHGMASGRDLCGYFGQVEVHRLRIAPGQHQARGLPLGRADGTEDVGRCGALIVRRAGTRAAQRPPPRDLVLLSDSGLVAEPNFYLAGIETSRAGDRRDDRRKGFLKASTAPAACA